MGKAKQLVFENGATFTGEGFGADKDAVCEVVFNTAMVGYQELFSNAAYYGQFICMTYPLIGNYGLAADDYETRTPCVGGFVVREYNDSMANFRAAKTLAEAMEESGIPGLQGVDTRQITRMLRSEGNMRALLCGAELESEEALEHLREAPPAQRGVEAVSCKKNWYWRTAGARFNVVAVDCGIKLGSLRRLAALGCNVTVVPHTAGAEAVLALAPDGVFFSGGPGNPAAAELSGVVRLAQALIGRLPVFGVGLGHQVLALAQGCKTYKLKCGHHGNHPVKRLSTGGVDITSQNHNYAVDAASVEGTGLEVTHTDLLDGVIEGLQNKKQRCFSVQFSPEGRPGPRDSLFLFQTFAELLENHKKGARGHA